MTVSFRSQAALLAAFASCALVATTFAQPGQTIQPPSSGQFGQPAQPPSQPSATSGPTQRPRTAESMERRTSDASQEVEQFLAQCLITKNQGEVEIAQFAAQRSQNPQVKQFAQRLIEDHQAVIQRLQGVAGPQAATQQDRNIRAAGYTAQENSPSATAPNLPGAGRDRDNASDRPRNEGTVVAGQSSSVQASGTARPGANTEVPALRELAAIERQVAERSQQALREKLQSKQGAEFDQCFVGSQVFCHMQMLATLEVIQQQTSGPLRQLAQESQPKVQHHLEEAEKLAAQLMDGSNRQADVQTRGPGVPR